MNYYLHPVFVHFPIVFSILLPILILAILLSSKNETLHNKTLYPLFLFSIITIIATTGALLTGSAGAEHLLKTPVKEATEKHEEIAEIAAMLIYVTTLLSLIISLFSAEKKRYYLKIILFISLLQAGLVIYTGKTGGELVYQSDAPRFLLQNSSTLEK